MLSSIVNAHKSNIKTLEDDLTLLDRLKTSGARVLSWDIKSDIKKNIADEKKSIKDMELLRAKTD